MRLKIAILYFSLLVFGQAFSQSVKMLPDDPRIQKGSIANGFTYYLIDNDIRPGYADFYLVRKVGSIYEDQGQYGFNTIIADMGVEGTRNFPNNTILSYFDELGLDHSSDLQITNGVENSLYRVTNIPVGARESVIDSTLLILYNWAVSINLDEDDVEVGKRFYLNTLYRDMAGDTLCDDIIDGVREYRAKDIRSFYYKWFSPERMALVVVGDIDVKSFDTKIKSLFQALPKFLETTEDRAVTFAEQDGPVVTVKRDPEGTESRLCIYLTTPSLPLNLRNTAVPYVQDYMVTLTEHLLSERLTALSKVMGNVFKVNSVEYGRYMGSGERDALKMEITVTSADVSAVLKRVVGMIYGLKRTGFGPAEFERVQGLYFRDLNYRYDWRILTPNHIYAQRSVDNFLYGGSLASIEMQKEYMDLVRYQIDVNKFNTFYTTFVRDGDNCVIDYTYPANRHIANVDQGDLVKVVNEALSSPSEDGIGGVEVKFPLRNGSEMTGSILSEYPEMITDSKVWNLSNGATVIFKRTQVEPNKFLFKAVSKGGLTLMNSNDYSREYINGIAEAAPAGDVSASDLSLFMKNENITLERGFNINTTSLSGSGYSSSLDEFMGLVNLYFQPVTYRGEDFDLYRKVKGEELVSRQFSPAKVFEDTLSTLMYHDSRFISRPDIEEFGKVDYSDAISFINKRFSNAANFYFIIVGDLDEGQLKEVVSRHIAPLPGKVTERENWMNVPIYLRKFDQEREVVMKMDTPRTICNITVAAPYPSSLKRFVESVIMSEVVKKRVSRELEDIGYPVTIDSEWIRYPEEFLVHSFTSVMGDHSPEYEDKVSEVLKDLREDGASSIEIGNVKKVLSEAFRRGENESLAFWSELLANRYVYGKDFYSRYLEYIDGASDEDINTMLREYLGGATNTVLTVKGEK